MAKAPGELDALRPISKEERESRKAFRIADATTAIKEHDTAQKAFAQNHERLKAERLAREVVEGPMLHPAAKLPDDTPIDKVLFPTRIRNALTVAGWKTVGEIREASDATLLGLQDLGKGSVSYLRDTLGLSSSEGVVRPGEG